MNIKEPKQIKIQKHLDAYDARKNILANALNEAGLELRGRCCVRDRQNIR